MTTTAPGAGGAAVGGAPLRYPLAALYADYLRAAFGLALTLGPLLLLELADVVIVPLAALALVFAWFGMRTVLRHLSRVELSESAIAVRGPASRHLGWGDLQFMKLAYYAPRRSRDDGWLQLTLRGAGGRPIRVDSTLTGFDQVLRVASGAARAKALPLDAATHANLAALGVEAAGGRDAALPISSPGRADAAAVLRASKVRW